MLFQSCRDPVHDSRLTAANRFRFAAKTFGLSFRQSHRVDFKEHALLSAKDDQSDRCRIARQYLFSKKRKKREKKERPFRNTFAEAAVSPERKGREKSFVSQPASFFCNFFFTFLSCY